MPAFWGSIIQCLKMVRHVTAATVANSLSAPDASRNDDDIASSSERSRLLNLSDEDDKSGDGTSVIITETLIQFVYIVNGLCYYVATYS